MRSALTDRPLIAHPYLGAWLVLLATLPMGLESYNSISRIGLTTWEPGSMMGVNYHVYHVAAESAIAWEPFYDIKPPGSPDGMVYLYPPITVVAFLPFTLLDWTTGYAVMTGLSVLASVVGTVLLVDYVESLDLRLGWFDIGLLLAAFLLSTHAMGTIYYGNVNLLLGFSFVLGFWSLNSHREGLAGVAFGLAALFKVFPAMVGLWLLRARHWRAVVAAGAVGVGGLLGGLLLFGLDTTVYYFTDVLAGRGGSTAFIGGYPPGGTYYVTLQRPLSYALWAVWPGAPYDVLPVMSVLVSLVLLVPFYRRLETALDRLMAIFATTVITVVVFPSFRFYIVLIYLPLVALLYGWRTGHGRAAFLAGGVIMSITYRPSDLIEILEGLPDPIGTVGTPLATVASLQLYGMVLMLVACAWYRSRTPGPERTLDPVPGHGGKPTSAPEADPSMPATTGE